MRVLSCPDYRAGNPYQSLLARALVSQGIEVIHPTDWRRGLPFTRMVLQYKPDLIHLHWPEAYVPNIDSGTSAADRARVIRWPADLALGSHGHPLVLTAHNLVPHRSSDSKLLEQSLHFTWKRADRIIAHSAAAAAALQTRWKVPSAKVVVIPHGDLAAPLPPPVSRQEARARLGLEDGPLVLMFGAIERYKGIDEVVDWWREANPGATLHIVGRSSDQHYGAELLSRVKGCTDVRLHDAWVEDDALSLWLSACDATLFNYRRSLTSGSAYLARSFGIPILLPRRLSTIDLGEPDPRVLRFEDLGQSLADQLRRALALGSSSEAALAWRKLTSWQAVAEKTAQVYRSLMNASPRPQP